MNICQKILIIILLLFSVGFFLYAFIYFLLQLRLKKNKGKSVTEKLLRPTCFLFFSIALHRYIAGFYIVVLKKSEDLVNAGYKWFDEIFNSLVRTMQTFSLDETYIESIAIGKELFIIEFGSYILSNFYGLFASFLNVCAPIVGVSFILGLLTSIFPRLRLKFWRYREKYVFSELNDRAICFAEDIINEAKNNKPPLIVFTDAYIDQNSEASSELFQRAKNIGAICIKDDILNLSFNRTKKLHYILIDEKDIDNIHTLTTLVTKNCEDWKKDSNIYLFSQNPEAESIVLKLYKNEWLKESKIVIRIVQEYTSIIYDLFNKVPLYYPLLGKEPINSSGEKELVLTIIGGGKIATEAFLGAYWFGQILNCKLRINVLTKNANEFMERINYINKEILESGIVIEDIPNQNDKELLRKKPNKELLRIYPNKDLSRIFSPKKEYADPYAEFFFKEVDVEKGSFNEILKEENNTDLPFLSSDYFIIALGTDELNITTALYIDRMVQKEALTKKDKKNKTVIAFSVYDSETNKIFSSGNSFDLETDSTYRYAFASLKNIYSCKNIYLNHIFKLAFDVNETHRELFKKNYFSNTEHYKKAFLSDPYRYWSSIAQVLHYKYKVYSSELLKNKRIIPGDITDIEKEEYLKKITDDILNKKLSWLEHRRWNAFMRTKGFSNATQDQWKIFAFKQKDEEKTHKSIELKLHPCIVECSEETSSLDDYWDDDKYKNKKEFDCLDIVSIIVYKKKIECMKIIEKRNFKNNDKPDNLAKKMMEVKEND